MARPDQEGSARDGEQGWLGIKYTIKNNNPNPISDVEVRLRFSASERAPQLLERIPDLAAGAVHTEKVSFDPPQPWTRNAASLETALTVPPADIIITFTDSHGLRWVRIGRHEPTRNELHRIKLHLLPLVAEYFRLSQAFWIVLRSYRRLHDRIYFKLVRRVEERGEKARSPRR